MNTVPRPPRPLDAATAQRLLVAAAAAFATDGMEAASLNRILERASMAKSSFYHRFADKAALHDWVTRTMKDAILDGVHVPDLKTLTAASFRPELDSLLERFQRLANARPELMDLGRMVHSATDDDAERAIAEVRAGLLGWIAEALHTGRELGVVRSDLPADLLSAWTVASLTAIDRWVLTSPAPLPARSASASTAIDALWSLLSPQNPV